MKLIIEYSGIISTFSILLPIVFCLLRIRKKAERHFQLFLLFLLFGFLIDLLGWYSHMVSLQGSSLTIIYWFYDHGYPMVEAAFFFWIVWSFSYKKTIKTISRYSILLTIPLWFFIKLVVGDKITIDIIDVNVFPAVYRIVCSFLSGFTLFELIEDGEKKLLHQYQFWILSAILFYCFTTFLVTFLGIEYGEKLWYLHNVMNILTYLLYSTGFYMSRKYA